MKCGYGDCHNILVKWCQEELKFITIKLFRVGPRLSHLKRLAQLTRMCVAHDKPWAFFRLDHRPQIQQKRHLQYQNIIIFTRNNESLIGPTSDEAPRHIFLWVDNLGWLLFFKRKWKMAECQNASIDRNRTATTNTTRLRLTPTQTHRRPRPLRASTEGASSLRRSSEALFSFPTTRGQQGCLYCVRATYLKM